MHPVDVQQRLLLIADIGGYTRYMLATRISLAHAQVAVTGLLEAVLDGATHLQLAKLEGDAAFFHAPAATAPAFANEVAEIRRRFLEKKQQLVADRMCNCAGCTQLEGLTLKFVAHTGEVAIHKVRQLEELSGIDVILVHRLLKNTVPIKEYVLVTDSLLSALPAQAGHDVQHQAEDLEGIGTTTTHYLDAAAFADVPPPRPRLPWATRYWHKLQMEFASLPYFVGIKKPTVASTPRDG